MKHHEYYCKRCGQLRLSFSETTKRCSNCGSTEIVIGNVLGLDKEALRKKYPLYEQERCGA